MVSLLDTDSLHQRVMTLHISAQPLQYISFAITETSVDWQKFRRTEAIEYYQIQQRISQLTPNEPQPFILICDEDKKSRADNELELFCKVIWWLFCMARTDNYLNSNRTLKMRAGYLRSTVHITLNVINGIHAGRFWVSSFTIRVQQDVSGAHWSRWNMCGRHVLPIAL